MPRVRDNECVCVAMGRAHKGNKAKQDKRVGNPLYTHGDFKCNCLLVTPPGPSDSSEGESASSDSSSQTKVKANASITVMKLQQKKTRLQDIVHALAEPLESISTADWSVQDLCRMIWILGRVKPNTLISQFKAKTYGQLNKTFGLRARRIEGKKGKTDEENGSRRCYDL